MKYYIRNDDEAYEEAKDFEDSSLIAGFLVMVLSISFPNLTLVVSSDEVENMNEEVDVFIRSNWSRWMKDLFE